MITLSEIYKEGYDEDDHSRRGLGSRLSEETILRPKPMVEIGGKPILWHIMNIYGAYGVNEFVIALGYKAESRQRIFPQLLRAE